ncbi:MFS general substrate transporter [Aaosphaeria arxii CBS 175.79]|uniref:MFS general substrate transporter n=1 Tax=Aaosphaeria arxii CBS 175.79 TaxID=1450172 RepID=A0A6A5X7V4_9PLEO|nr:MFS general substrate transporter [Aaosphaeria arxii CBS 175.79]KAF2009023.1 MFS general substrate transporter [Aaosphaeria arxii CBS 175.79]
MAAMDDKNSEITTHRDAAERSVEKPHSGTPTSSNGSSHADHLADSADKEFSQTVDSYHSSHSDLVDWDGLDDPDHPTNWRPALKWRNVLVVATLTFLTPFASSMFAPVLDQVMQDMGTSNRDVGSFAVSIYLLGYAFGPLFLAPCSEIYGRLPVYHVCTFLFILMNIACALSVNMPMLIIFRLFTGLVGACPLTVGPGTVSDCFKQAERGRAMSVWTMPVLLGPCVGPVVGAYVSRALGWRWVFWVLIIMAVAVFALSIVFQRETYPPTLLEQKTKKLRKITGNPSLESAATFNKPQRQAITTGFVRPMKLLFYSPIVLGLSLLTAVAYGTLYLLFTTITELFQVQYGIVNNVGLVYFGFGFGQVAGLTIFGLVSDAIVQKMSKGGEMKPEYRLPPMVPGGAMIPIGLLLYGWTAQSGVFWFVPIIGTVLIGIGMITVFTPVATYLVDAFPAYAASATAANTVFRSIGGALLPLAGPKMYQRLGYGWGNTLLAGISFGMMGMIWLSLKYGERLRTNPKYQLKL